MKRWHAFFFAWLILVLAACPQRQPDAPGPEVMSFLSASRALHRQADIHEDANRPNDAIATLDRVVALPRPSPTPEIHEVLADTHARLADTHLKQVQLVEAMDHVRKGLVHAQAPTFFRGHLLEIEGAILEAESKKLRAAGQESEALAKRKEALARLNDAVAIHEKVIRQQLGDAGTTQ